MLTLALYCLSLQADLGVEVISVESSQPRFLYSQAGSLAIHSGAEVLSRHPETRKWSRHVVAKDDVPLYVEGGGRIVTFSLATRIKDTSGASEPFYQHGLRHTALNAYPAIAGDSVTIFAGRTLTIPSADKLDGFGIARSGERVAWVSVPMGVSIIKTFRLVDGQWIKEAREISPEVEGVGYCLVAKGLNEVVFLDNENIAFLGTFAMYADTAAVERLNRLIPDMRGHVVSSRGPTMDDCFLFVCNLRGRTTFAGMRLSYLRVGYGGELGFGNLGLTHDGKRLVIPCRGRILLVPVAKLLKAGHGQRVG